MSELLATVLLFIWFVDKWVNMVEVDENEGIIVELGVSRWVVDGHEPWTEGSLSVLYLFMNKSGAGAVIPNCVPVFSYPAESDIKSGCVAAGPKGVFGTSASSVY